MYLSTPLDCATVPQTVYSFSRLAMGEGENLDGWKCAEASL